MSAAHAPTGSDTRAGAESPAPATGPALLVLEDGTAFRGHAIGARGTVFGEAVFNTGMAGYQEVLTDPSYHRQIVTMTATQVGNYGMNDQDAESESIKVAGFVVREAARRASSWRSQRELRAALAEEGVVGIEGVDTRALTRHLREGGSMRAGLSTEVLDVDALLAEVRESPSMEGAELASEVTPTEAFVVPAVGEARFRVVALDFGMKRSIRRELASRGIEVHVLTAAATPDDVREREPHGVFLSPGPGDPSTVSQGIATTRELLGEVPVFGICLGSQLLGHALGAETYKLTFGHHGVNQPVLRRSDGGVEITSHNHGFAVQASSLGERTGEHTFASREHGEVEVSHVNLNDDVVEGLRATEIPAFSVQYHPEAAPGPTDARHHFTRFVDVVAAHQGRNSNAAHQGRDPNAVHQGRDPNAAHQGPNSSTTHTGGR